MGKIESWQSGPVAGIPSLLQPVAHGLLNAREQIVEAIEGLEPEQLTARPAGIASIAFHVRHAMGSLDRLFTYARGENLSAEQRSALAVETREDAETDTQGLIELLNRGIDHALDQLRSTGERDLLASRTIGRAKLPSTTLGLLFHGAEHSARHAGQVVTTAKLVRGG